MCSNCYKPETIHIGMKQYISVWDFYLRRISWWTPVKLSSHLSPSSDLFPENVDVRRLRIMKWLRNNSKIQDQKKHNVLKEQNMKIRGRSILWSKMYYNQNISDKYVSSLGCIEGNTPRKYTGRHKNVLLCLLDMQ